jgi:hypothetical protein
MPNIRDACEVVIFLFHTCCSACVSSALVHDRGGPPRGALCCPFGRPTETTAIFPVSKADVSDTASKWNTEWPTHWNLLRFCMNLLSITHKKEPKQTVGRENVFTQSYFVLLILICLSSLPYLQFSFTCQMKLEEFLCFRDMRECKYYFYISKERDFSGEFSKISYFVSHLVKRKRKNVSLSFSLFLLYKYKFWSVSMVLT